jgi:hypothetical protein
MLPFGTAAGGALFIECDSRINGITSVTPPPDTEVPNSIVETVAVSGLVTHSNYPAYCFANNLPFPLDSCY